MHLRCLHTCILIKTPSLEGLPTKAKEDPSPHEMRLSPTGHQPSISWSRGNYYHYYYYYYEQFLDRRSISIYYILLLIYVLLKHLKKKAWMKNHGGSNYFSWKQIISVGNGSRMSDKKLTILEFKYLRNKKWYKQAVKRTRTRKLHNILTVFISLR